MVEQCVICSKLFYKGDTKKEQLLPVFNQVIEFNGSALFKSLNEMHYRHYKIYLNTVHQPFCPKIVQDFAVIISGAITKDFQNKDSIEDEVQNNFQFSDI